MCHARALPFYHGKAGRKLERREFTDFERVTHKGKYAVLYDIAHDKDGGLYYLSIAGSRQMSEGIAAALLDSGHRNKNTVYLDTPLNGEDGLWNRSTRISVATHTIGAMRRNTRKVQGTRVFQVVLVSNLIKWDYNYAHMQTKAVIDEKDEPDQAKAQKELAQRRFILMADEDEDRTAIAQRWFAYLPKRVSEPMLADWAQPLWDYCVLAKKGIEPLTRLRGKAWLCEPSSEVLRDAIGYLGRSGELPLPDGFPEIVQPVEYELAAD